MLICQLAVRVEEHVAGRGSAVGRGRQKRLGQHAGAKVDGMPIRMSPNRGSSCWLPLVASGLPLSETWARLYVADGLPDSRGLLELEFPGRRRKLGVECLEQDARSTTDAGPIGHETEGDAAAVNPRAAVCADIARDGLRDSSSNGRVDRFREFPIDGTADLRVDLNIANSLTFMERFRCSEFNVVLRWKDWLRMMTRQRSQRSSVSSHCRSPTEA